MLDLLALLDLVAFADTTPLSRAEITVPLVAFGMPRKAARRVARIVTRSIVRGTPLRRASLARAVAPARTRPSA